MQALSTLSTPEEKLAVLCKKYIDLEENMQQAREEEESHRKATSHFQFTLNEIEVQLEWCEIPNAKLHQENIELREKLKTLTGRCTLSKEDIDKVLNHKGLEHQLVAKLQQTTQLIQETDEKHQREREFLLKEATESRHRYEEMKRQEVHLKQQMTKKTAKMEKKMIVWRTKREDNNKVLLQMAEEKTIRDKEHRTFQMKLKRLEKLFRALQMERNELCEKVEVLKKKDSVKEADVNLATHVIQPHTALDSQKELNTSSKRAPGVYLRVEPKSVKKTKRRSKAPFHMT